MTIGQQIYIFTLDNSPTHVVEHTVSLDFNPTNFCFTCYSGEATALTFFALHHNTFVAIVGKVALNKSFPVTKEIVSA